MLKTNYKWGNWITGTNCNSRAIRYIDPKLVYWSWTQRFIRCLSSASLFVCCLQGLKPFSTYHAIGMKILHSVDRGSFINSDIYWAHAALTRDERPDILLITDRYSQRTFRIIDLHFFQFWFAFVWIELNLIFTHHRFIYIYLKFWNT